MILKGVFFFCILVFPFLPVSHAQKAAIVNSNTFGEIKARHIGPATMSGRISAIDAVQTDPRIIYIGSAGGGLWKSENGGIKCKPIFDDYTMSIGAIHIVQKSPDTVYVGTGESWVRNSVSVGDGVYKTTNGGESWIKCGLDSSERISKIVVNPENPELLYVAALGNLWNPNKERGVFRSKDGGASWEKILYIDENTGCSDITINPLNPDLLFAGMWQHRRSPYSFRSGGPGSGLYMSEDGGDSWQELKTGLPGTEMGRIAIAVSPVTPEMVYAVIEAADDKGGLFRSDDNGKNWTRVNNSPAVTERPFYFQQIYPDPVDTMRVYKPGLNLNVSDNGGDNFSLAYINGGNIHVDHHALWINKYDNNILYLGTDGGVYKSIDQGKTWTMIRNLPVSQFYRVSIDMANPYRVYGGLQDNGSWTGPSMNPGGIENSDWDKVGFGDGFYVFADANDPNILYWQWQGGNFVRYYRNTKEAKEIKPYADEQTARLRWNWNSSIHMSPSTSAIYVGAQYLFKSFDRGDTWKRISPDLTTDDPKRQEQENTGGITIDNSTAENNATIYAIAESPLDSNIIWVGTDDGYLQLTKDGGASWENITPNIPGLPEGNWVSSLQPGRFDESVIFVTFDNHRTGDMKPYIYLSEDFGKSFIPLKDENIEGYCFKILQDPIKPELLFLGTELGLFASVDKGENWSRFTGNIPKVAIREMVIHPHTHDLVLATHGRGIFIIDDLSPLRAVSGKILDEDLFFLPSRPYFISTPTQQQNFAGDDLFTGQNPVDGVYINYYLKKRHIFGDMYMEIFDPEGNKVAELPAGKRKGINREVWIPREKPPKVPASNTLIGGILYGPTQLPGDYKVRIVKGDTAYEGQVSVRFDPDLPHTEAEREIQLKTLRKAYMMLEDLAFLDEKIKGVMEDVKKIAMNKKLNPALTNRLLNYTKKIENLHEELVATKMGGITGEEQLREKIANIYGALMRYYGKPTHSQIERLNALEKTLQEKADIADILLGKELGQINHKVIKKGFEKILVLSREEFDSQ